MKIAVYQGTSPVSLAIRFLTRSKYSHAAYLFDEPAAAAAAELNASGKLLDPLPNCGVGAVIEAWSGGVKNPISLSALHTPGTKVDIFELVTPLTPVQESMLVQLLATDIGDPYSYINVIRFVTKRAGEEDDAWFCSELVFDRLAAVGVKLFNETKGWEVPPDWLHRSSMLRRVDTVLTV